MAWIKEHRRVWRTAVLLLVAVALVGPWAFEGVYVPPKDRCSPPYIPWEGDHCGVPLPGLLVFFMPISAFDELLRAVNQLEPDQALQMFSMLLAATLTLLPVFITFYLIVGRGRSFRVQVLAWGMAALTGPYLARTNFSSPHPSSSGLWLFVGLAVCALALELLAFVADKQSVPAPAPGR